MRLKLSKGYIAIVDDNDPKKPWRFKWHAWEAFRPDGSLRTVYARRSVVLPNGKKKMVRLHRWLLGVNKRSVEVDHKDSDGLNNRRKNLRKASKEQNGCNRKVGINNTSGHKGVVWYKRYGMWQAKIKSNGVDIHLGYFENKREAVLVRQAAEKFLQREFRK